ncbi:MAG: nuclease-related domain-containing protein [Acidimicrobiales bacterium]
MTVPGGARLIRLRYPASCAACGGVLERGARAWWDQGARAAECTACRPADSDDLEPAGGAPPAPPGAEPLVAGTAGGSARATYERRHARREQRIEERWGRPAGVVKFLTDDPQSTRAWAQGSEGERLLAEVLARTVGDRAVLLHDRKVPRTRGNIDHLAVAPPGVWVIDAKRYRGRVEHRDVGGWFRTDLRLYVGGRDRTNAVEGLAWQVDAVRHALAALATPGLIVPLHPALCFVDAEWPLFAKPFTHDGVRVSGPRSLAEAIGAGGALNREAVELVARQLATALPPATS